MTDLPNFNLMTKADLLYIKVTALTDQIATLNEQLELLTEEWQNAKDQEDVE